MTPKVSIIVTAFLEKSKPYLDLCIESIMNLDYPKERLDVLIVSPLGYRPKYDNTAVVHPLMDSYNNAQALNFGASRAHADSEYLLFLNDDVILTRNSLTGLIASSQSLRDQGIFMPIGNDQQGRYMWSVPHLEPGPYRLEAFAWAPSTFKQTLMNAESPYTRGLMFCESLCMYAVLIPRQVFAAVGPFDESGWQDDIDYSRRVAKAGGVNAICMNSLVYHAGGVTADVTLGALDSEERKKSLENHYAKWGAENV